MSTTPSPRKPGPQRLLVRGVNWLGDAVMTTPALLRLREHFPQAHIAISTADKLAPLWETHPAVNEVIAVTPGEGVRAVARRLRGGNFDTALVLPNSPRSALEPWLAGIPRRVGLARPWRNWFLTEALPPRPGRVAMRKRSTSEVKRLAGPAPAADSTLQFADRPRVLAPQAHQVFEYLHLAAALGVNSNPVAPALHVPDKEVEAVKAKFGLLDKLRPLFGLNFAAEYGPAKRWPLEKFTATASEVIKQTRCRWLVFASASDDVEARALELALGGICGANSVVNLAGKTSLRELLALLKACHLLLTNDTGPMHLAAALGTPVVALFGSTSPELTGPGLPGDRRHRVISLDVPCAPCFLRQCPIDLRCLTNILPDRVTQTVVEIARRQGI